MIVNVLKEVSYGLRIARKNPGFAAIVIVTLALGIGANAAIFSIFNAVVLRPLPYPESHRLVRLMEVTPDQILFSASHPTFLDWRDRNRAFEHLAAWQDATFNWLAESNAERVSGAAVSSEFLPVLGRSPVRGRNFSEEEDRFGNDAPVVIVSHRFWQTRLGGDPAVLGRNLILNENSHTIIGVLPETFRWGAAELYTPLRANPGRNRDDHRLLVIARLRENATIDDARSDMNRLARQLGEEFPSSNGGWTVNIQSMYDWFVPEETRQALKIALAAVGVVLMIAFANVANLLLARTVGRRRELSIRIALGASRRRVFSQLFVEVLLLAMVAGAAGLILAMGGAEVLSRLDPGNLPRIEEIRIDARVVGFTLLVSVAAGLIFGLLGAFQVSPSRLGAALQEGGRVGGGSPAMQRVRSLLIVAEIAASMTLLVGAGLLFRSMWSLQRVSPGFEPSNILATSINLPDSKYPGDANWNFYTRLLQETAAAPGVQSAALTSIFPMSDGNTVMDVFVEGISRGPNGSLPIAGWRLISPGYFRTLGIPLRGRDFGKNNGRAAIISEEMARRFWPNSDPIGSTFDGWGEPENRFTVIGVAGDVRSFGLDQDDGPMVYLAAEGTNWNPMVLTVRTASDPSGFVSTIRTVFRSLDPNLAISTIQTGDQIIAASIGERRFNMLLLMSFATLALTLAAIGLFGVMAYVVSQRINEIGIRMALGARPENIFRLVIGRGMLLATAGSIIGLVGAFWLARMLQSFLFQTTSSDPLTFASVLVLLLTVAFLASYIPARRATRVDPLTALRQ